MRSGPPVVAVAPTAVLCLASIACGPGASTPRGGSPEVESPADIAEPPAAETPATPPIPGFSRAGARRQRGRERRFLAALSSETAAANARWLSAAPHMAGTDRQARVADSLAHRLRTMGFRVESERFRVWFPHPGESTLEMLAPRRHSVELREAYVEPGDPHGRTWNAYAGAGTATASVVYANYGVAEDYAALEERDVDVEGKIVLVRYGGVYRGTKVREAEARGAAGVVLYPDPEDGGSAAGDTLPVGPYRPSGAAQRGTVSYLWRHPGDPLTPGRPAGPDARRLDPDSARNVPRIPVLNVTADRARKILSALEGPEAPESFQGGWSEDYRTGPGPAVLRMRVKPRTRLRTIRNVLAWMPGRGDQMVIIGNHYDAWVRGGVDPHSGTATVLEIARGLSALQKQGWYPRRDILLAFWDAEEFGAAGSTEFVEARRNELRRRAVAYLNVDVLTAGTLDVSGSPSLRDMVWSAAGEVEDPLEERSLADGWRSAAGSRDDRPALGALGVGSDWTAFFHFAGIPSLQWTMNGRGVYSPYHSALDDFEYLRTHADSALLHVPRLAGVMGITALRLADAEALPFDYARYAERIGHLIDSATLSGAGGDGKPGEDEIEQLREVVGEFRTVAESANARRIRALRRRDDRYLQRLNRAMPRVEGDFLRERRRSSWYRHLVYSSDPRTGYGALSLPSLRPNRWRGDSTRGGPRAGAEGRRVPDRDVSAPSVAELIRALESAARTLRNAAPKTED